MLGRGFDDDRGVGDLTLLRKNDTYVGPVLFVSGRIPDLALQERIRGLGADGPTNSEEDVVRWLERIAKG